MNLEKIIDNSFFGKTLRLSKKLIIYPLMLSMLAGCGKKGEEEILGPGNGGGSNSGVTNSNGDVTLVVNSQEFDINVENEISLELSDINVECDYNGGGQYQFLAKDFSDNYFCETAYYPNSSVNSSVNSININMILSTINPYSGDFKIEEKKVPFSNPHQNLDSLGTVALSDLHEFYQENDNLIKYKSYLEFVANVSDIPWFTVALKAEEFREVFIENASNVSEIIGYIANLFGQGFDPDAYYLDVYSNDLGILTHFENEDDYCTVKGVVEYNNNPVGNAFVSIVSGPTPLDSVIITSSSGEYILKFLNEGSYIFKATYLGNEDLESKVVNAPTPPFYNSTIVNFDIESQQGDVYDIADYISVTQGNWWVYEIGGTSQTITVEVDGYQQISGINVPIIRQSDGIDVYQGYDGDEFKTFGFFYYGQVLYIPPILVGDDEITLGETYETETRENGIDPIETHKYKYQDLENVFVPAGIFNDCLYVKNTLTVYGESITQYAWLAEGVGQVMVEGPYGDYIELLEAYVDGVHYGGPGFLSGGQNVSCDVGAVIFNSYKIKNNIIGNNKQPIR